MINLYSNYYNMNKETDNQKSYNYRFEPIFNNSFQIFEQYPVNTRINNNENVNQDLHNYSTNSNQNRHITTTKSNSTTSYVDSFGILPESTRINNKYDNSNDQQYYTNPKNTHLPIYNNTGVNTHINPSICNQKTKYVENYQPLSMNQSMPINNKPIYDTIIPMNTRLDHSKPINSKKNNYVPNI